MKTLLRLLKSVGSALIAIGTVGATIAGMVWIDEHITPMIPLIIFGAAILAVIARLFYYTVFDGKKP